jgi:hypothetical protein
MLDYCADSRNLAAHPATTSSSRTTFKFRLFLGPPSCLNVMNDEVLSDFFRVAYSQTLDSKIVSKYKLFRACSWKNWGGDVGGVDSGSGEFQGGASHEWIRTSPIQVLFRDPMSDADVCIIEAWNIMCDESRGIWKVVAVAGLKKNLHCHWYLHYGK